MHIRENLKKGTVEMIILHLLEETDMYGYELLQEMRRRSSNKFALKDGSLYPLLYRMIDKDLITDKQVLVGRRRVRVYYHITDEGREYLNQITKEYYYITEGINEILNYQGDNS